MAVDRGEPLNMLSAHLLKIKFFGDATSLPDIPLWTVLTISQSDHPNVFQSILAVWPPVTPAVCYKSSATMLVFFSIRSRRKSVKRPIDLYRVWCG